MHHILQPNVSISEKKYGPDQNRYRYPLAQVDLLV